MKLLFKERFVRDLDKITDTESLRLQSATSNAGRGGRRYIPYAFAEHGIAMLSSVLGSQRSVQMNILIIRKVESWERL